MKGLRVKSLRRFIAAEQGQDLVEYAMLMAFTSLVCIVGLQNLGTVTTSLGGGS